MSEATKELAVASGVVQTWRRMGEHEVLQPGDHWVEPHHGVTAWYACEWWVSDEFAEPPRLQEPYARVSEWFVGEDAELQAARASRKAADEMSLPWRCRFTDEELGPYESPYEEKKDG